MNPPMSRLVRILVLVAIVGGASLAMVWRVFVDEERRLREELAQVEAEMARQIELREAMIDRLARTRRRGLVEILDQRPVLGGESDGPQVVTDVRFVELDEDGRELGRRAWSIPGEVLFIDGWTARFPHERVAAGDPLGGSTVLLLRRVYSDLMPPREGFPIDTPGGVPDGYALAEQSRMEQSIWTNFWRLASDPAAAAAEGVRVAQGEAVYKRVRAGEAYELLVEAAGGMTLVPVAPASEVATAHTSEP